MASGLLFAGMDGIFDEVGQDDGQVGAESRIFLGDDGFDGNGHVQGFGFGQIRRQGGVDQGILTILFALGLIQLGTDFLDELQGFLGTMGHDELFQFVQVGLAFFIYGLHLVL